MRRNIFLLFFAPIFFFSTVRAENGLWTDGKEKVDERVNVGLKAVTPDAYIKVTEKADSSVVNISTTQIVKAQRRGPMHRGPGGLNPFGDPFGDDFFDRFFGPQQDFRQQSLGSGFILNSDGYVVTNNHVVDQASEIKVILSDESSYLAKVIGRDPKTDVALLKIDAKKKLSSVILGDSSVLKVGEIVIAIGNPFGFSHTVTQGIVSGKERTIRFGNYDDFIQTDASINPGNSGGPLLNLQGEVIGINAAIIASGQGIGFAIPINLAKSVLLKLKNQGKVVRGWLGVGIQKVTEEHAQALQLANRKGALVSDVQKGSPAERAGIKAGDVIVRFNGKVINDSAELPLEVANTAVGTVAKVEIIRDGKTKVVDLKVGELKEDEVEEVGEASKKVDQLGLQVKDLNEAMLHSLGLEKGTKGVVISSVDETGAAFERGVRPGDVIIEVDRKKIEGLESYRSAVKGKKKGDTVLLLIKRGGNATLYIAFKL